MQRISGQMSDQMSCLVQTARADRVLLNLALWDQGAPPAAACGTVALRVFPGRPGTPASASAPAGRRARFALELGATADGARVQGAGLPTSTRPRRSPTWLACSSWPGDRRPATQHAAGQRTSCSRGRSHRLWPGPGIRLTLHHTTARTC